MEDIKSTFTILRAGSIDETERTYTSSKRVWLDSATEGAGHVAYEVYDGSDVWVITNTGSKTISANGNTDYTISFYYTTYGRNPSDDSEPFEEVGGTGILGLDENGNASFIYGGPPEKPVVLKAGESVCITASALGSDSPENQISEIVLSIDYGGETGDNCHYTFYFGYDPVEKAAIEKALVFKEPDSGYTDVPDWCSGAVNWAVYNEITNGVGGNRFAPNDPCTHAQILTFLWRAEGEPPSTAALPVDISGKNLAYAETALRWASEKGMIGARFDPTLPCARGDAVIYIWKALDEPEAEEFDAFPDVTSEDKTLFRAVSFAIIAGITNGYDNGDGTYVFRPNKVCSRGEIVTFLHRTYVPGANMHKS